MDTRDIALTLAIRSRSWRSGEYDEVQPLGQRRQGQSGAAVAPQEPTDAQHTEQDSERDRSAAAHRT
jgi:hypothetical protein